MSVMAPIQSQYTSHTLIRIFSCTPEKFCIKYERKLCFGRKTMAYSALDLMDRANRIYEMDEKKFVDQLACLLLWTAEAGLIALAAFLYLMS